ncbi:hypothetical protein ACJX0J_001969, partial (mitochondrion) [Zea mays]
AFNHGAMNIVDRVMEEGGPFRENLNSNIKSQTTRKQIPTGQNLEKNKNRMVPLTHNSEGIKNKEHNRMKRKLFHFKYFFLWKKEGGRGRVEEILKVIEENENRKEQ